MILLPQLVTVRLADLLPQMKVFFFEVQELLLHVLSTALSLYIENVLQVRNFSLQFQNEGVIRCGNLVRCHFLKNLFGPISEFQRRYGLFRVVN